MGEWSEETERRVMLALSTCRADALEETGREPSYTDLARAALGVLTVDFVLIRKDPA